MIEKENGKGVVEVHEEVMQWWTRESSWMKKRVRRGRTVKNGWGQRTRFPAGVAEWLECGY